MRLCHASNLCYARYRTLAIAQMPERVVFLGETAVKTNLTRMTAMVTSAAS